MNTRQHESAPGSLATARFVEQIRSQDQRREVVGTWALRPVGRRPPLPVYLRQLWQRRHFVWADARARAFSGGRGMLLGNVWLVLQPLLNGFTYFVIFGLLLQTDRGIENFIGYLIIGVFLFQYTARSLSNGSSAITGNRNIIRGFTFPRASLPLAVSAREMLNMFPVITTMLVMITFIPPYAELSWRWALFPAVFALHSVFNLGLVFIVARITAHIPDLKNLITFISRFWFYGSAVMFTYDRFVEDPQILALLELNPVFIVLDMTRDSLLYATTPELSSWMVLSAWAAGTAVLGFLFFWRAEERYGRE